MSNDKEYDYDVFISYSHKDRAWVRGTLLPRLEEAGLKVCIDYRDFRPGAASPKEMERAIVTSANTLLILTPAYGDSAWSEFENLMLQVLDPANRERRLIPLLKERYDLPVRLKYLTYVDFTDPEELDLAWTQLLTALGAPPVQEAPETPARENWRLVHAYPVPPNFTGRADERAMLSRWLNEDPARPLLVLRALGGFGKSALAWHWLLNDVDPARWPRVLWWGFYDDQSCEAFVAETLDYLGVTPRGPGPRQLIEALISALHPPGTLLILDGFERTLRAYNHMMAAYQGDDLAQDGTRADRRSDTQHAIRDCVSPIGEHLLRSLAALPGIRAKVLITTRLTPRILEAHGDLLQGCREERLTRMQPADTVTFFRAQGIRGARAEIERACAPYGYHPLSLRLLAGLIARDPQQPGDIAAARRLDVTGDLVQRQHHVLEQAYENLAPGRQALLGRIACFRGPVRYQVLQALAEQTPTPSAEPEPQRRGFLRRLFGQKKKKEGTTVGDQEGHPYDLGADLRDLAARGLLHRDRKTGRYDLHPIVRRYAYDRLGDQEGVHSRLRDYFATVPAPDRVQRLEDLAPAIELYHHTVRAGLYDEAIRLFRDRVSEATYYQFGAYQLRIELLRALSPDGEDEPPRLKTKRDQSWTANALANSYSLSGQPGRAIPLFQVSADLDESQDDKTNLAVALGNLADDQLKIGAPRAPRPTCAAGSPCAARARTNSARRSGTRSWGGCWPTGARGRRRRRSWTRRWRCLRKKSTCRDRASPGPTGRCARC